MSLNCIGLGSLEKRRDVLNYIKQKQFSIYFLQDTHFTEDDYEQIRAFWGYNIYISPGRSDARGTAILLNNNFEHHVKNELKDENGNYLILEINVCNKYDILLVNLYGPNTDCPDFFQSISDIISNYDGEFVVTAGDFNLVQDPQLDYYNYNHVNNQKARTTVLNMKETHNFIDPWRARYDTLRRYTWFKTNPVKKARLDYFLISSELMAFVEKVNISPGYRSDHSVIELTLSLLDFDKGRGFWKFNNSLLRDDNYIKLVKDTITTVNKRPRGHIAHLSHIG